MAKDGSRTLLGRLRAAVKKVRFLMNFNLYRWRLASIIGGGASYSSSKSLNDRAARDGRRLDGGASSSSSKRWLSFNDRLGLNVVTDEIEDVNSNDGSAGGSSSSSHGIQRTISFPSSEDDVDKRAEMFIANFYRQLRMERQVSLELSYHRDSTS